MLKNIALKISLLPIIKTGELEPLPEAPEHIKARVQITIRFYGLNLYERTKARLREWERFIKDGQAVIDDYNYRYFLD